MPVAAQSIGPLPSITVLRDGTVGFIPDQAAFRGPDQARAVLADYAKAIAHGKTALLTGTTASDGTPEYRLSVAAYRIAPTREALSASTFHAATRVLGDTGGIGYVAVSPDSHTLPVGSSDGSVRLYDISNVKVPIFLSSLTDHTNTVRWVTFSPDGRTLASAGDDNTVRLWDTDPNEAARDICSLIITHLTRSQWQHYFPDLPYQRPC